MNAEPKEKSHQKTSKTSETNNSSQSEIWLDNIALFWLHFGRFWRDIFGIGILTLAVITLIGITGGTEGRLISPWAAFLQHWFGRGSYIAIFLVGFLGLKIIFSAKKKTSGTIKLGQILALEGLIFCFLTLVAISGGHSLDRAEQGLDGGLIGWGLAEIATQVLPLQLINPILILLLVLLILYGFGIIQLISSLFERWVFSAEEEILAAEEDNEDDAPSKEKRKSPKPQRKSKGAKSGTDSTRMEDLAQDDSDSEPNSRDKRLPKLSLLLNEKANPLDEEHIHDSAALIEKTLAEFGIPSRVVGFRVGPTVTQFAVEPGYIEKTAPDGTTFRQKVRISQISSLSRDLALALSAKQLRIEAPVPGHSFVGIEAPNPQASIVRMRPLLESREFQRLTSPLTIALGRNVSGRAVVADLIRMPHLLIAGTTGSGKSVCIQAIATCLVMNNTPDNLRLAMIDPKMVELVRFNGLPHLFGRVETELDRILGILRWALVEMDNRYRILETARARDIDSYNKKMRRKKGQTLPRIVILIDELADLMMSAPDQTENSLVRLAQMARATGIHLVVATQRPSTDVVTGLIKANFPSRVSFTVASSTDSRVILDTNGAETLLGHGDMLFLNHEQGIPIRAQGVMITDQEIEKVIGHWKAQDGEAAEAPPWEELLEGDEDAGDDLLDKAIELIRLSQRASTSMLQRRLRIGYPRAARLMDQLEEMGIVGPSLGGGRERDILITPDGDTES